MDPHFILLSGGNHKRAGSCDQNASESMSLSGYSDPARF